MSPGWRELAGEIGVGGHRALLVIARSSRDPDLAPFVGEAHLGASFLIAPAGDPEPPHLGYLTAMEREEAAATGCRQLTPAALGVASLREGESSETRRWSELLRRGLELAKVPPGPVAVAGGAPAGLLLAASQALAEHGWRLVDGGPVVARLRKRKSREERQEARRVAAATAGAFVRVAALLAAVEPRQGELWLEGERLTAGRLRQEVAAALARHELEQPEGNIVSAGPDSAVPHTRGPSERVLRAGESLIVDLFPRGRLYADCSRTFCVGEPPAELRAAHRSVLAALEAAHGEAAAGTEAWSLQEAACDRFEAAGYPTLRSDPETERGYVHGLGHGVGYELHELPGFRRAAGAGEGRLEEGDLFTLEPGLYDPTAGWGVRLEDLCLLGGSGLECLTPLPYELDPRAWVARGGSPAPPFASSPVAG